MSLNGFIVFRRLIMKCKVKSLQKIKDRELLKEKITSLEENKKLKEENTQLQTVHDMYHDLLSHIHKVVYYLYGKRYYNMGSDVWSCNTYMIQDIYKKLPGKIFKRKPKWSELSE